MELGSSSMEISQTFNRNHYSCISWQVQWGIPGGNERVGWPRWRPCYCFCCDDDDDIGDDEVQQVLDYFARIKKNYMFVRPLFLWTIGRKIPVEAVYIYVFTMKNEPLALGERDPYKASDDKN